MHITLVSVLCSSICKREKKLKYFFHNSLVYALSAVSLVVSHIGLSWPYTPLSESSHGGAAGSLYPPTTDIKTFQ